MADILIRGMEMPKEVPVWGAIFPSGDVYVMDQNWKGFKAVPLPEGHGRLGDLDALYEVAKTRSMGLYGPCNYQCVVTGNDILKAPTIVPAEGGADNAPKAD